MLREQRIIRKSLATVNPVNHNNDPLDEACPLVPKHHGENQLISAWIFLLLHPGIMIALRVYDWMHRSCALGENLLLSFYPRISYYTDS